LQWWYQCPFCRDLCKFKQQLKDARLDVTRKILDRSVLVTGADLTALWTGRVDMLLVELYSMALRGKRTCKFALCVAGSLARKEACAYSDIEAFVLLEHTQGDQELERRREPFRLAANRCIQMFTELGEHGRGFTFDSGLSPFEFVYPPGLMLDIIKMEARTATGMLDVLHDHRLVMGDKALYQEWCDLSKAALAKISSSPDQALKEWRKWMMNQYVRPEEGARRPSLSDLGVEIKDHYYRWLQKIPKFLCQFHSLADMQNTRAEVLGLQKGGMMSKPVADLFLDCLDKVTRLRMVAHLKTGSNQAGNSLLAREAPDDASPKVTHVTVKGKVESEDRQVAKTVLKPAGLEMVRDLVPKINALITMAQDFLEWAPQEMAQVESGFKRTVARPSPFLSDKPNAYKRLYSWSENVLLPKDAK
jgi:hypothetical protein